MSRDGAIIALGVVAVMFAIPLYNSNTSPQEFFGGMALIPWRSLSFAGQSAAAGIVIILILLVVRAAWKQVDTHALEAPMPNSSEGVRRLSIFAGGIGSFLWLCYVFLESNGFSRIHREEWLIVIGGLVGFFFVGFGLVRAVTWVIGGFTRE
jgi:hypothetical protein